MTDFLSPAERSERMSRIRSKDTEPEMKIRKFLHSLGLRYRLHRTDLPGKPDLVFPKFKAVVFIHGCFWHRHECRLATTPKSNVAFWIKKFQKNVIRDDKAKQELELLGWRVFVVWQCEISTASKTKITANCLSSTIRQEMGARIGDPVSHGRQAGTKT